MGLESFYLMYDNGTAVYFAGQLITGKVIVELSSPKTMRGIILKFKGEATVHWTERHSSQSGRNRRSRTVHYRNQETYFEHRFFVFGTGQQTQLESGQHMFNFAYTLPTNIPSSFEGVHGYMRYTVKATIDRPWKFDHEIKVPFTVNSLLDLNREALAQQTACNEDHKYVCCLCCRSGPISAKANIVRIGHVPGEAITFNAEVNNQSDRVMTASRVKLVEHVTFHAVGKSRSHERTVSKYEHGVINPGDMDVWRDTLIPVPPLPPSHLIFCSIIDISYRLDFIVDPSGVAIDLVVSLPLIIGTIPLRQLFPSFQPAVTSMAPPQLSDTGAGLSPTAPPPLPASEYPDLPPPSYEECVFGATNIRHEEEDNEYVGGEMNYTPRYITYNTGDQTVKNYGLV